jgi:hypothetical protein
MLMAVEEVASLGGPGIAARVLAAEDTTEEKVSESKRSKAGCQN